MHDNIVNEATQSAIYMYVKLYSTDTSSLINSLAQRPVRSRIVPALVQPLPDGCLLRK
jgi:hypothetical protein